MYFHEFCLQMEYYVKWLGFGASSNTWEPSFNFMSPETISEYHERLERKQLKMKDKRHKTVSNCKIKSFTTNQSTCIIHNFNLFTRWRMQAMSNGNNENLQEMFTKSRRTSCMPEKVLNIYQDENGELICLLAFKGQSHPTYVPAEWANVTCPELVIKFYEGRIYWSLDDNKLIKHINENNWLRINYNISRID